VLVEYAADLDAKDVVAPWGNEVTLFLTAAAQGFCEEGELGRLADRTQAAGLAFMIMKRGFSIARAEYDLIA
jgi:hypothetical protein